MIVVTLEMSMQPRQDDMGNKYDKEPSQPDERTRIVLDTTQSFETVANLQVEALINIRVEVKLK
jgi:hypothetical protein